MSNKLKLRWNQENKSEWWGHLYPMFWITKSKGKYILIYIRHWRHSRNQKTEIECDSLHQAKCMAAEIIKASGGV